MKQFTKNKNIYKISLNGYYGSSINNVHVNVQYDNSVHQYYLGKKYLRDGEDLTYKFHRNFI